MKLLKNPISYVVISIHPLQHNSKLVFLLRNPIQDYEKYIIFLSHACFGSKLTSKSLRAQCLHLVLYPK